MDIDVDLLGTKAQKLKSFIDDPPILVLPNVWDVGCARIVEKAAYPVIAISSAGIAWSLGYPDGEQINRDEMLYVIKRISLNVHVPVTADLEGGYGDAPESVADTVWKLPPSQFFFTAVYGKLCKQQINRYRAERGEKPLR